MKTLEIRPLLEELGYTVVLRTNTWTECLVSGHDECWLGRGVDGRGACQDAFRQMFPSEAARLVLKSRKPVVVVEPEPEVETVVATPKPKRRILVESQPPKPVVVEAPKEEPLPSFKDPSIEPVKKVLAEAAPEPTPEPPKPVDVYVSREPEPEPEIDPEPEITREEAIELVQFIGLEIEDGLDDLAIMAPPVQRLNIAAWMFRGRAVQEKFKGDEGIEEEVHKVAQRLTAICKNFWPGSVRALQVYTTPAQALEGLFKSKEIPPKWERSAELLMGHMEEVEDRPGYDSFGWKDRTHLKPDAPNPRAILLEAIAKIEAVIGPLNESHDDKRRSVTGARVRDNMEDLVLAAHLLRWIRKSCPEPQRWGNAMGALRWASRQSRSGNDALRQVLQEEHMPSKPWAQLLGRDPEVNRKNRLTKEVMAALPTAGWLEEDIQAWLVKAFQVFTNPQIAKMAAEVNNRILDFTAMDFADADRNARRRLRKLQEIIESQKDVSKVKLPDAEKLKVVEDETPPETRPPATANEILLGQVQEVTRDKHILFVTNRDDTRLQKELEEALQAKVTLKNGGNPRLMKAILKGVSSRRYDMVLMATGFNNHSADAALCRTTKGEGLPYVRVQKGRRASTIRALGRAFNVDGQGKGDDETAVANVG